MSSNDRNKNTVQLRIRRTIPASPERVFAAWTDPDALKKWWGPKGVRCLSAAIDLRVGGNYKIENELSDGTVLWIVGEFEVVEPPRLLVYTWSVGSKSSDPERVTVRFEKHQQGTEIVLLHELIPSDELRDQHQNGWYGCLDGLAEFLSEC
ncbi:MAG: SRPBCC family protein [Hyphomicrobiaceae bacterium]